MGEYAEINFFQRYENQLVFLFARNFSQSRSPNLAFLCRNLDYKPYSINPKAETRIKINIFRKNICLLVITSHRVKIISKFSQVD